MGVSFGSSIYNAPSIYESGAGGGGSEGENGAGSVNMPEGFTRLLYFENNKVNNFFRCRIDNINIDSDCVFEFCFKSPTMVDGMTDTFYLIGNLSSDKSIEIGLRDWTSYVGTTYFSILKFFGYSYQGSTITNLSNRVINMKLSKNGLYIDDNLIISFSGSFNSNTYNGLYFPYQLNNDFKKDDIYIYKFLVKKDDSVLVDCLPVKNDDTNQIGFIDLISGLFYPCDQSIAGPIFPY